MRPSDFLETPEWQHRKKEVLHEILAVCLPVGLYSLAMALSHQTNHPMELTYYLGIPDGFFGGCILYALAIIHSINYRRSAQDDVTRIGSSLARWPYFGLLGIMVCAVLSVFSAIFHPPWALVSGLMSIYFGGLAYKSVVFCRSFLEAKNEH